MPCVLRSVGLGLALCALACDGAPKPTPVPAKEVASTKAAPPPDAPPDATAKPAKPGKPVKDRSMHKAFAEEEQVLRRRMAAAVKRSEKVRGYMAWQAAGATALQIARLTGNYEDFRVAEQTITKAFEVGEGHGPSLLRARFNYHVHRLDSIDADLPSARSRAMVGGNKATAAVKVFEGNLAMQRGQLDQAKALWAEAEGLEKGSAKLALALWAFKTADFDTAEELYADLGRNYHGREGEGAAWFDLVQGIMDLERGRYDDALGHLDEADKDLSGYWLVDEHRAEITALKGDLKTAETMYREIIERTNNPEFMDALASLLIDTDRKPEAQQWINRATTRFNEQIALYPEASYGHALGHFLDFGPPERALELARKNHKVRPNIEAKMLLAQAELGMGNVQPAKALIDASLATEWSTADLHHTASEVYKAAGDTAKADAQLAKAKAINPKIDQ